MSSKEFASLSITGSVLEVPPPKESSVPRPIDKKKISPTDNSKRNSATITTVSKIFKPVNRSISQMSNQVACKKNSIVSLSSSEDHAKYEVFFMKKLQINNKYIYV